MDERKYQDETGGTKEVLSEKGIVFSGKTMEEFEKEQQEANRRMRDDYGNFTKNAW